MTQLPKDLIANSSSSSTPYRDRQEVEDTPDPDAFKELMEAPDEEEESTGEEPGLLLPLMSLPSPQLQDKGLSALLAVASVKSTPALSPDAAQLFEKMAASMLVLYASGDTETTLFVESRDSIFCGTRITIKEFSTAPKVFNVHIASNPSSLHLINAHKAALLSSFEQGKFPFSVHRLETEHQPGDFDEQSEHEQEE